MATWLYQLIVFTTSVIFIICSPSDHPVFSASSSSLFCPFLGDERPNIRPSTIQIQVQPAIMAIETCTSSTSRWCKWRPTVPVSLYPALDVTMSAAEHAHGFHVIQERRILSHVNYSTPPTNRLLYWSTYDLSIFISAHRRYVIIDIVLVVCLRLSATTTVLYSSKFGVIHLTNSPYLIIYCDEQTSMPYPWHHPLLHQDLCLLVQYHD